MLLTPAQASILTDKLTASWLATLSGMGDGTYGASLKALDLQGIVSGSTSSSFIDPTLESMLVPAAVKIVNPTALAIWGGIFGPFTRTMDSVCTMSRLSVSTTINSLDTFLYWYNYLNGGTYWQCLCAPDWASAYLSARGVVPNPLNCYFPCLQGGTYANALGELVVGTGFTAGYAININPGAANTTPAFAGGFPYLKVASITGSGLCTVNGLDQNGNAQVWTATISATGTTALTASGSTPTWSLITSVTGISVASGISAGTIYVEAHAPTGRTYPPT